MGNMYFRYADYSIQTKICYVSYFFQFKPIIFKTLTDLTSNIKIVNN